MVLLIPLLLVAEEPLVFPPAPGLVHPLKYGDKVQESIITEIMDKKEDKIALIAFFNPKEPPKYYAYHLSYVDALYERYKAKGLLVVAISGIDSLSLDSFKKRYKLHFPFIFDKDWRLHRDFGVVAVYTRTFIIDKNGKVLFSYPSFPDNQLLRQIIEKHILRVPRIVSEGSLFKSGEKLPEIHLRDRNGKENLLSKFYGKPLVVAILSPVLLRCGSCGSSRKVMALNKFVDKVEKVGGKLIAIINYPVNKEEITKFEKKLKYSLFSTPDLMETFVNLKSTAYPLIVLVNEKGEILLCREAGEEGYKEFLNLLECK